MNGVLQWTARHFLTCIPLFGPHLLSTYCVPDPLLGTREARRMMKHDQGGFGSRQNLFPWCPLAGHGGCGSCSFATLVPIKQRASALETVHLLVVTLGKPLHLCVSHL